MCVPTATSLLTETHSALGQDATAGCRWCEGGMGGEGVAGAVVGWLERVVVVIVIVMVLTPPHNRG